LLKAAQLLGSKLSPYFTGLKKTIDKVEIY